MRLRCWRRAWRTKLAIPLNSLHIHLQLMERKAQGLDHDAKAELQQSIDVARSEVRRLDSIVTQFLRAIRPSHPRLHPENVNTIVEEAVRFFTPEIQDRDMVVEQELRVGSAFASDWIVNR